MLGAVVSLLMSLLALLIDLQVGAVGCLQTQVFNADHYSSLFGPSDTAQAEDGEALWESDMSSSQNNEDGPNDEAAGSNDPRTSKRDSPIAADDDG